MNRALLLKRQIIQRARTLAGVMTSNPNLKVTISGTQAWQIPGQINIPHGDFTDPTWLAMIEGWIDHELGHEKHSLDEPYEISSQIPALNTLMQIIEDVRMERAVCNQFRGARTNLHRLVVQMVKLNLFVPASSLKHAEANELMFLRALCLYRGRAQVLQQDALYPLSIDAYETSVNTFGQNLTDAICSVIDRFDELSDTYDSLTAAQEILAMLVCKKNELEHEQFKSASQGTNSSSKASGHVISKPDVEDVFNAIERALSVQHYDLPPDFHEELALLIGQQAHDAQEMAHVWCSGEIELTESKGLRSSRVLDKKVSKRLSGSIYQALHKVIFDQVQNLPTHHSKGSRIKNSKLAGISAGNFSVFKQRIDQPTVAAALSVLVDSSSSMMDVPTVMRDANTSALAFAMGAEKSGLSTEVVYYGLKAGGVYTAKRFDEPIKSDNFTVIGTGSTPTGEAMHVAMNSLIMRPEKNKMMCILTDGEPNNASLVRQATDILRALGIKVIPIGIGCQHVNGFEGGEFVSVSDANELPQALKQAVRLGLFK